jgi:hypothetical protein
MGPFLRNANKEPETRARIPSAPSTRQPRGKATPEDIQDIENLTKGIYGAAAGITGFNGWLITDAEATAIAEPAARILARHTVIQGYVREVADPVALVVAAGLPTLVRYQLWRDFVRAKAELEARGVRFEDLPRQKNAAANNPSPQEPSQADTVPAWKRPASDTISRLGETA